MEENDIPDYSGLSVMELFEELEIIHLQQEVLAASLRIEKLKEQLVKNQINLLSK